MEKRIQKRFGTVAVEKGFITADQLVKALAIQTHKNVEKGKHRLLGRILADQGVNTDSQIDEILESMTRTMEYVLAVGR